MIVSLILIMSTWLILVMALSIIFAPLGIRLWGLSSQATAAFLTFAIIVLSTTSLGESIFRIINNCRKPHSEEKVRIDVFEKILEVLRLCRHLSLRYDEFHADKFAVDIGYNSGLKDYLKRMTIIENKPTDQLVYWTHPKAGERIRRLEELR